MLLVVRDLGQLSLRIYIRGSNGPINITLSVAIVSAHVVFGVDQVTLYSILTISSHSLWIFGQRAAVQRITDVFLLDRATSLQN